MVQPSPAESSQIPPATGYELGYGQECGIAGASGDGAVVATMPIVGQRELESEPRSAGAGGVLGHIGAELTHGARPMTPDLPALGSRLEGALLQ